MNLRVQREDGRIETISVRGDCKVLHGKELDRLSGDDIEHFFTKDGFYDGWGAAVRLSEPEADRVLNAMEEERRIDD